MKNVAPYLIFNGNCKEALEFYKTHLGGELFMTTYGDASKHGGGNFPPGNENKIIHGSITKGNFMMMASDTHAEAPVTGDNIQLCLQCDDRAEVDRLFSAFSEGGKINLKVEETFWGSYFGMVKDKFGIDWMLNFEFARKSQ